MGCGTSKQSRAIRTNQLVQADQYLQTLINLSRRIEDQIFTYEDNKTVTEDFTELRVNLMQIRSEQIHQKKPKKQTFSLLQTSVNTAAIKLLTINVATKMVKDKALYLKLNEAWQKCLGDIQNVIIFFVVMMYSCRILPIHFV
jgi:hypothetical protein